MFEIGQMLLFAGLAAFVFCPAPRRRARRRSPRRRAAVGVSIVISGLLPIAIVTRNTIAASDPGLAVALLAGTCLCFGLLLLLALTPARPTAGDPAA
jgi:hypothetical protein